MGSPQHAALGSWSVSAPGVAPPQGLVLTLTQRWAVSELDVCPSLLDNYVMILQRWYRFQFPVQSQIYTLSRHNGDSAVGPRSISEIWIQFAQLYDSILWKGKIWGFFNCSGPRNGTEFPARGQLFWEMVHTLILTLLSHHLYQACLVSSLGPL